ncbi:hypothetical protein HDU76_010841, partial [Blyttiomyces sp. JEL0837]
TFKVLLSGAATVDSCQAAALAGGYKYCGVEYGGECWGDNQFRNTTSAWAKGTDCNMKCNLNATQ